MHKSTLATSHVSTPKFPLPTPAPLTNCHLWTGPLSLNPRCEQYTIPVRCCPAPKSSTKHSAMNSLPDKSAPVVKHRQNWGARLLLVGPRATRVIADSELGPIPLLLTAPTSDQFGNGTSGATSQLLLHQDRGIKINFRFRRTGQLKGRTNTGRDSIIQPREMAESGPTVKGLIKTRPGPGWTWTIRQLSDTVVKGRMWIVSANHCVGS